MIPETKNLHFLGIAGTAMGSAAVMAARSGYAVTGSDQSVYSPMSDYLDQEKISYQSGYSPSNLPPQVDLVIVGNAISRGNPELEAVLNNRTAYMSLPEFLRFFYLEKTTNICVTGTHGKTSTSAMTTFLFEKAELNPGYFIGGIPADFTTSARSGGDYFILEADEYDSAFFDKRSKFLHYLPRMGLINNIEFDHADIFSSLAEIELSFERFVKLIPDNGFLLYNGDCQSSSKVAVTSRCYRESFGFSDNCDWQIQNINQESEFQTFDLVGPEIELQGVRVKLPGRHMASNASAAIILGIHAGIDPVQAADFISAFNGVARRAESVKLKSGAILIDDFAHHPTAIRLTLEGLKKAYQRKMLVLVEPRSNTMVRNIFTDQLISALKYADEVLFSQIHRKDKIPVNEQLPIDKVINGLQKQGVKAKQLESAEDFIEEVAQFIQADSLIVMLSNGSFMNLKAQIIETF